jgi:hypothetical protein
MNEICIPFGHIADDKMAEVEIRVPGTGIVWRYRIESVAVRQVSEESMIRQEEINILQQYIHSYNQDWELIQIYDMDKRTGNIHMLYREKQLGQPVNNI